MEYSLKSVELATGNLQKGLEKIFSSTVLLKIPLNSLHALERSWQYAENPKQVLKIGRKSQVIHVTVASFRE